MRKPASLADLPNIIPVFPLDGVLLLPQGSLPLNIFEPRYVAMVDHALSTHRLIGMIQPKAGGLYDVGCVGRITSYAETDDARYLVTLSGIARFRVLREEPQTKGFRNMAVAWVDFAHDLDPTKNVDVHRGSLIAYLKPYFTKNNMTCEWETLDTIDDSTLITALAMICPLNAAEKQALLEAPCCKSRAQMFLSFLEMSSKTGDDDCGSCH